MKTMAITCQLPKPLKDYLDEQLAQGKHESVEAYVSSLIIADLQRRMAESFAPMLLADLDSADVQKMSAAERENHQQRRLEELRRQIAQARQQVARGEDIDAEETLHELSDPPKKATRRAR